MIGSAVRIYGSAITILAMLLTGAAVLADGLAGSEWRPVQLGDHSVEDSASLFVRLEAEGRVAGNGGCDRFPGSCQITDDRISIGPPGATRTTCSEPVMELEMTFFQALEQARGFTRDAARLVPVDAQGNTGAIFQQTDWD